MKKGTSLNSVFDIDISSRILIEASAGTGKTYNIVGLVIRLLIEKNLPIEEVLVVTFTKKATNELRDRVLQRLRDCVKMLDGELDTTDSFLVDFAAWTDSKFPDSSQPHAILRRAIQNFDDAQVLTIHGFCQKVLSEEALLAGSPMEMEISATDNLLEQAAEDFWRSFVAEHSGTEAGEYYINKLMSIGETPAELMKALQPLFGKPYATIEGKEMKDPIGYLQQVIDLRKKLVSCWENDREEILDILNNCDVSRYQQHFDSRLSKLNLFISDKTYDVDKPKSLEYFTSDYLLEPSNTKKGYEPPPGHRFFELCSQFQELIGPTGEVETTLIKKAHKEILEKRTESAAESPEVTYDDLLNELESALADPESGKKLAQKLRHRYPFALVDEFQDTDPVQYQIFDRIYPQNEKSCSLMMIGDPKQAIYAFRGADIYTYFRAKKEIGESYLTLDKNYRSRPKLVEAVNKLFSYADTPFIENTIGFQPSESGREDLKNEFLVDGEPSVPLSITYRPGVSSNKDEPKEYAFNQTVRQISELLEKSKAGNATIKGEKLRAGDIAILINSHKEAADLKKRLQKIGIGAVTQSNRSVFDTLEAQRFYLLMAAVMEPGNRRAVHNCLMSGFFGRDLEKIYELQDSEEDQAAFVEKLQHYREIWFKQGFYAMYRNLMYSDKSLMNLSEMENSERIITNLNQLARMGVEMEVNEKQDPATLLRWFEKEISDPDNEDEKTLLLESDRNLVKIITVHSSKGLQFPVVFCPMLWDAKEPSNKKKHGYEYHSGENGSDLVINIDRGDTEEKEAAKTYSRIESIAEDVRKMYVALTRAEFECRIMWSAKNKSHLSGFGSALFGRDFVIDAIENNKKLKEGDELSDQNIYSILKELSLSSPESIQLIESDDDSEQTRRFVEDQKEGEELRLKTYTGRPQLTVAHQMESFSSINSHKADSDDPDYDQLTRWIEQMDREKETEKEHTIFTFPKGANAGTAIHKMFEDEAFSFTDIISGRYGEFIPDVLKQYGYSKKWTPVVKAMLKNVALAEFDGIQLADIPRNDELREMEFHFPVSGMQLNDLLDVIRKGGDQIPFQSDEKFTLKGFIDLIIRKNGKFYVLDYKSNFLGDSIQDYSEKRVSEELEKANYDLQAHIYTVALVKYLRGKIPDFNYERHFGGAAYLFIRGMEAGSGRGIWFKKPTEDVIHNLEQILSRS